MTAYTSAASGNWSAAATWTPSGVPASGDTVTVAAGMTVTVDKSATVGTSPAALTYGSQAILVNAGATLAVAAGVTLTVRGDTALAKGILSLAAGSGYLFDASQSSAPSTTGYVIDVANDYNVFTGALVANGTKGNRATISTLSGSQAGRISAGLLYSPNANGSYGPWRDGGAVRLSYCNLVNVGDASNHAIEFWLTSGNGAKTTPAYLWFLRNCRFTGCGQVHSYTDIPDASSLEISSTTFASSADTTPLHLSFVGVMTSGKRSLTSVVFDKAPQLYNPYSLTVTGCVFGDTYDIGATAAVGLSVTGCLWINSAHTNSSLGNALAYGMTFSGNYVVNTQASYVNPHFLPFVTLGNTSNTGATVLSGNVCEFVGTDANGDFFMIEPAGAGTSAANTIAITGNIVLPCSGGGGQSAVLITDFGGAGSNGASACNYSLSLTGNTSCSAGVNGEGSLNIDENYGGAANQYSAIRNNLFYGTSALTGTNTQFGIYIENTPATDEIPASVLDYNAHWHMSDGTCTSNGASITTHGYQHLVFSSGTPGAHDVKEVDPKFVDSSRCMASWSTSLGGAGTAVDAVAQVSKMNDDTGYSSGYTVAALLAWVRAGFAPQSPAYKGTGYGGADIGAVAVVLPPAKTVTAISFSPSSGDLDAGNTVSITVNLSGTVTVTGGTPTLALSNGAAASYNSGSGTAALVFSYTVATGHDASSLAVASSSPVSLGTASVLDANGIAPDWSAAAGASPSGLIQIDTTAPSLSSVTLSPSTGYLIAGATLSATVTFSEAVAVSGKPALTLSNETVLTYSSGSGSKALLFSGTIAAGQDATSLAVKAVSVSGAVLTDLAGNAASLSAAIGSVASSPIVDTVAPTATLSTSASATLRLGDTCSITLTMSEAIVVSGAAPTLSLSSGGAATLTSSTSTILVFSYTVGSTDKSGALSVTGLVGTVADLAGNALAAVSGSLGVAVNSTAAASTGSSVTLVKPSSLGSATTLAATDGLLVRVGGKLQILSVASLLTVLGLPASK